MECKYCGCKEFYREQKGPHLGVYCSSCGRWQKWEKQPCNEGKTKEDYKNEYMDKQTASDEQVYYIRNLLRQVTLSKYQAGRIIEILGGEVIDK